MALPGGGLIRFGRRAPAPDPGGPGAAELIAALPTPLLVIDPDGVITEANAAAETLLNASRAALIGKSAGSQIAGLLAAAPIDAPFAAYDVVLTLPDQRRRRGDVVAAPLPDRPGWRVVTIHAAAPQHIVSRPPERQGGTLTAVGAAAMLAHEIKNPLSGIRGAAQLLETSCDDGSRDLTSLIRDEVDRVAALIDRMEGFTDTRPLALEPQNIHAILAHVRDVAAQGFARDYVLREIYDPSLPDVLGHRDTLIQVLLNLLKNAAEAMPEGEGATITLTTAYRHGLSVRARGGDGRQPLPIEICVIDEGPGAPEEIADHLFDPFVTSKRTGTGLGLALVDKLVADLGGIVEYAREGQPPRTVFRLLLPRAGLGMTQTRILVVDDDAAIRTVVKEALRREGHVVQTAASVAEQRRALDSFAPHVLVTDVILPDGNGLDLVPEMLRTYPRMPVIVLSAQNTLATAVRATEQGAFEYLPKPFDLGELTRAVADAVAAGGVAATEAAAAGPTEELPLIGRSPPMQEVYRTIARVVANDLTVLILGESGTGKELVARVIHDLGPRARKPFVAINMAAIPRELIESELFGHERGAFTGAQARTAGRFEQAQGGTLFLDEIGDMPFEAQTRLLRVLQAGEFTPVGGQRSIRADVRIIAATHKDLPRLIADNAFREDLYYRLNVVPVRLPPLRQRAEDIAELSRHFLDRAVADGLPRKQLSAGAIERLAQHGWPGNVRELENLMRRLAALSREELITGALVEQQLSGGAGPEPAYALATAGGLADAVEMHLARYFATFGRDLPPDGLFDRVIAEVERPLLRLTLAAAHGNQLRAARLLGINRNTLRKKLTECGIDPGDVRKMG